ncbi:MAG: oligoendopeptidase F [Bacillota bacterium]|nr:oligoendopeptidase F [Bacillota bacterium]
MKNRNEIPQAETWAVERIYPDQDAWEADFLQVKPLLEAAAAWEGRLGEGPAALLDFLQAEEKLSRLVDKLYLYAAMRQDEDNNDQLFQGLRSRIEALAVEANASLSWFGPQLLALPEEQVQSYLDSPELALYRRMLENILRERPHVLSGPEQRLLAASGEMGGAFHNIYSLLNDADLPLPSIEGKDGRPLQLSHGNYVPLLRDPDRALRERAFRAMYQTYARLGNTIAGLYAASVKKDNFYAQAQHYKSALAASLFSDNVPEEVYTQLIATVRAHQPDMKEYLRRRKALLGVDRLHMWDIYTPLFPELPLDFSWEQAKSITLQALAPLGPDYVAALSTGLEDRWCDVWETKGKTSGAYSSGVYDSEPYMLLNFQNDLNSVFTLAHEAGHSMHSYYSRKHQPYVYGDYRIFVAEVASTVNETLLSDYLLAHADKKSEVRYLVNHYLEEARTTVFRQTMFAEFELETHRMAAEGRPLTAESLCQLYYQLNKDYFGDEIEVDEEIAWEWARIPHFYRAFYVYKYATGFCAASALAQGLIDPDAEKAAAAQKRYLGFLKAGSTKDPIDLLHDAGVDMRSPEPVDRTLKMFGQLVRTLE